MKQLSLGTSLLLAVSIMFSANYASAASASSAAPLLQPLTFVRILKRSFLAVMVLSLIRVATKSDSKKETKYRDRITCAKKLVKRGKLVEALRELWEIYDSYVIGSMGKSANLKIDTELGYVKSALVDSADPLVFGEPIKPYGFLGNLMIRIKCVNGLVKDFEALTLAIATWVLLGGKDGAEQFRRDAANFLVN